MKRERGSPWQKGLDEDHVMLMNVSLWRIRPLEAVCFAIMDGPPYTLAEELSFMKYYQKTKSML